MEIKHILLIMFVIFCAFMVANWLNRPKPKFGKKSDTPIE
jgi:HAMP domain-containing protein